MEKLGFTMTSDDWAGEGEAVQFNPPFYVKAPNGKKVECQFKYNWYYDEFFVLGDYWAGDLYENDEPTGIPTIQTMIDKLATYGFHDLYVDDWNDINSLLYINDFTPRIDACSHENLSIKTMEVLNGELLLTLDCDKCGKRTSTSASLNQGWEAEDLNTWAQQEMTSHGQNVSFKDFIKKEIKSHGNIDLVDWAKHEKQSHTKKYGVESFSLDSKKADNINMEEPVIEEPSFIPDGDGRAIGQQNSSINLSPLHAETFEATPKWECDACGDMHDDEDDAESCCIEDCDHTDSEMTSWGHAGQGSDFWMSCNNCGAEGHGTFNRIYWEHDDKTLEHEQTAESFNAEGLYSNRAMEEFAKMKEEREDWQNTDPNQCSNCGGTTRWPMGKYVVCITCLKPLYSLQGKLYADAQPHWTGSKRWRNQFNAETFDASKGMYMTGHQVDNYLNMQKEIEELRAFKKLVSDTVKQQQGPHLRAMLKELLTMDFNAEREDISSWYAVCPSCGSDNWGEQEGYECRDCNHVFNHPHHISQSEAATYSPSSSPDMVNEIQTSPTNESPQLFNASNTFNVTSALGISGLVVAALSLPMLYSSAKSRLGKSAEEKRKASGSVRKNHTQVKNSEYSVGQVNPVEAEGQQDIHGAEGITNPRHAPSASPAGYPSKSLKMW